MQKKILFCVVLMLIMVSAVAMASEYRSEVSVGLIYGNTGKESVNVSSATGMNIYNAQTGDLLYTAQPGEEVYIEMGLTGFASFEKFDGSGIPKISAQPHEGGIISCDGKKYRGYIFMERRPQGELLVINYVGTDDYVSSVLGKEMSYTWPKEALKAQAVCARNFVLCSGSKHKEYGFDVCTTTHCQVYGGVDSEHENTRQATEETKGVLAKYNGEVVALYFFATSGGQTEDVENVWGSPYGYLKSVADPYEDADKASHYSWTMTLTKNEIEEKLKAYGAKIGSLKNITVDKVTSSGRIVLMTFHGTEGTYSANLAKCRTILGTYSQKFTVTPDVSSFLVTTGGNVTGKLYACSADGINEITSYTALTGNGEKKNININSSGAGKYTLNGNGYGHGVGMSQWGARGMAENGFTYDRILKHYFTDIELG